MTAGSGYLRLNCLRILQGVHVAYEEQFHEGVNIIRGQNGSGKSSIADFIFFILGGEFDDWKEAAGHCDEVQAEIQTPRGELTLRRQVAKSREPILVYFGSMEDALESSVERWERFPIRRQARRKSFSQVMFRSLQIPEAQSEGAANVTMHQILRLCYSDQRTPAPRLFRFEQFDTHNIREVVGDLICGISDYELYEIGLEVREQERKLAEVTARLRAMQSALPSRESLNTPERIEAEMQKLRNEATALRCEIDTVDELVEPGEVKAYLGKRKAEQADLITQRDAITNLELAQKNLEFELREIEEFVGFLGELEEKIGFAEATFRAIGSIEFTHCPACSQELDAGTPRLHCVVCKSPIDLDREGARYNQIRFDLEIQARESRQLIEQKRRERREIQSKLLRLRRQHEREQSAFDLQYAGANGPREAFLASRIKRIGYIEAEIRFLQRSLDLASQIAELLEARIALTARIESLRAREKVLRGESEKRRPDALSLVSEFAASILREDLDRQAEFGGAGSVGIDFRSDSISVDGSVNFAESSNVFLKNAAVLGLLLAAGTDEEFNHPRFLLIDNIEDKGMEESRSHLFQQILVERVTELGKSCQVIYTTSMMNPNLEVENYTIGPAYTSENRSLRLMA